ncbi:MAG: T9SS type A sorting domain-containing protein [Bacteroidales bacterium]|nr:T9SS type A sorting domain-containing protein [Bacteroidales bacterium]
MKTRSTIVGILLLVSANLFSQYTIDWVNPCGNFNKIGVMSAVDNLDNLIITGYFQSENIYTRKYDINGNLLWETIDSSAINGKYEKPIWLNCDINNNVFVVGKRYSISSVWEYPDAMVALKYNSSGMLQWKQTVPVSVLIGSQHPGFNLRSEVDDNGNIYIGTAAADPSGFILVKIDPNGNILFTHNSEVNAPTGFSSMRLKDNKVVLTGSSGTASTAPIAAWDTSGTLLWTNSVSGKAGNDVEVDDDGNTFLLTSFSNQVTSTSGQDVVIYKFNPSGVQLWKKDYDFGGSDFPTRFTLVSNRLSTIGYASGSGYFDWIIFQTDTGGNKIWDSRYNGTSFNDEYPYYIVAKPDNNVIVTGTGGPSPDPLNLSYLQMVILEYSSTGAQLWVDTPNMYGGAGLSCTLAGDNSLFAMSYYNMTAYHYDATSLGGMNDNKNNGQAINIFPNPCSTSATIEFYMAKEEENVSVLISDLFGNLVKQFPFKNLLAGTNRISIDLSELKTGLYFCEINSNISYKRAKFLKY